MFKTLPFTDKIFAIFILTTTFSICWIDTSFIPPTGMIALIYIIASTGQLYLLKKRRETKSLKIGFIGMCILMLGIHAIILYLLHFLAIGISWSGKYFPISYTVTFWLSSLMAIWNTIYVIAAIIQSWTND